MVRFLLGKKRLISLFVVLVLSFIVVSVDLSKTADTVRLGPLDRALFWLVAPLQRIVASFGGGFGSIWTDYVALVHLKEKNDHLVEEVQRLRRTVDELREKAGLADRLAGLLQFRDSNPFEVKVARVIGVDAGGYFRSLMLDKGEQDGVRFQSAVATADGVVGRVTRLHPSYCQVVLLVDYGSAIDALIQRTRERGIVAGQGQAECEMKYVDRQADVQVGDIVITSGMDGVYPKGLVIGTVTTIDDGQYGLFHKLLIKPAADIGKLEEVLLLLREKP